ncbi:hypothetical protein BJ742DRAFT_833103 [Cladochytrium replicatum]|nr:hypothetical protein BJ742DRAFT_833103 [Cladochytrium replicatum]
MATVSSASIGTVDSQPQKSKSTNDLHRFSITTSPAQTPTHITNRPSILRSQIRSSSTPIPSTARNGFPRVRASLSKERLTGSVASPTGLNIKKPMPGGPQPKDYMPDFEDKLLEGTRRLNSSFVLEDGLAFIQYGAQAIAQDEFSKCFQQKPRRSFSLKALQFPAYCAGFLFRYFVLFPYRLLFLIFASELFFLLLPLVLATNDIEYMRSLFNWYCKCFMRSFGSQIRFHGAKPKLNVPHLFVANHTSFVDYLVLSSHIYPHATVAQRTGGVMGYFLDRVLKLNGTLAFNRNEKNDRSRVSKMIREHVHSPWKSPLLIFPEGTCVNNEYTVLFHKGAFELDAAVCPVAIKYNKRWADAYWSTKTQTFVTHILYLMTRWALVADVWYLPPMKKLDGESSAQFADRVKAIISKQARLKNLSWDGYYKNYAPAKDKAERLREAPQSRFAAVLVNRTRADPTTFQLPSFGRYGTRQRRNSIAIGEVRAAAQAVAATNVHLRLRPLHVSEHNPFDQSDLSKAEAMTAIRNEILRAVEDNDPGAEMIEAIANRKNDVVETWKRYTKFRSPDDVRRRIENSSWRIWFKRRIEYQREREHEAAYEAAAREERRRREEQVAASAAEAMAERYRLQRGRQQVPGSPKRTQSGSALSKLAGLSSFRAATVSGGGGTGWVGLFSPTREVPTRLRAMDSPGASTIASSDGESEKPVSGFYFSTEHREEDAIAQKPSGVNTDEESDNTAESVRTVVEEIQKEDLMRGGRDLLQGAEMQMVC